MNTEAPDFAVQARQLKDVANSKVIVKEDLNRIHSSMYKQILLFSESMKTLFTAISTSKNNAEELKHIKRALFDCKKVLTDLNPCLEALEAIKQRMTASTIPLLYEMIENVTNLKARAEKISENTAGRMLLLEEEMSRHDQAVRNELKQHDSCNVNCSLKEIDGPDLELKYTIKLCEMHGQHCFKTSEITEVESNAEVAHITLKDGAYHILPTDAYTKMKNWYVKKGMKAPWKQVSQ